MQNQTIHFVFTFATEEFMQTPQIPSPAFHGKYVKSKQEYDLYVHQKSGWVVEVWQNPLLLTQLSISTLDCLVCELKDGASIFFTCFEAGYYLTSTYFPKKLSSLEVSQDCEVHAMIHQCAETAIQLSLCYFNPTHVSMS